MEFQVCDTSQDLAGTATFFHPFWTSAFYQRKSLDPDIWENFSTMKMACRMASPGTLLFVTSWLILCKMQLSSSIPNEASVSHFLSGLAVCLLPSWQQQSPALLEEPTKTSGCEPWKKPFCILPSGGLVSQWICPCSLWFNAKCCCLIHAGQHHSVLKGMELFMKLGANLWV